MKNKKTITLIALLGLLTIVSYCSSQNYFRLGRGSPNTADGTTSTPIGTPDGADDSQDYFAVTDSWTQESQIQLIAAEIVFVMDYSGSMSDNAEAVKDSLISWLGTLETLGLNDYCIGLIPSVNDGNAGKLENSNDGKKCFCKQDGLSASSIQTKFEEALDQRTFSGNSDVESGLYAAYQALTDTTILNSNQTAGCFRNDMSLALVFISDEQDIVLGHPHTTCLTCTARDVNGNCTATTPTTVTVDGGSVLLKDVMFDDSFSKYGQSGWSSTKTANNYNPVDCAEAKVRLEKYTNAVTNGDGKVENFLTPQSVADELIAYNNTLPSYGTSITYPPYSISGFAFNDPTASAESVGGGLIEFADIMEQDYISMTIADTDTQNQFNTEMDAIAEDLISQLTFLRKFDFSDPVCEGLEDSVVVKVNGTTVSSTKWTLASNRESLTFKPSYVFHEGDDVDIRYTACTD